jgi:hypothetical protein
MYGEDEDVKNRHRIDRKNSKVVIILGLEIAEEEDVQKRKEKKRKETKKTWNRLEISKAKIIICSEITVVVVVVA